LASPSSSTVVGNLFQSSAVYFLSSVLSNGAMFLNSIVVSWYLGREGLGIFSLCLTTVLIGTLLSDMGLNTLILRDHAGSSKAPSFSLRLLLKVRALAALAITVVAVSVGVTLFRESALVVSAAALLILPRSISGIAESHLKARFQRRPFFIITLVFSLLQIFFVWGVTAGGGGLQVVFLVLAALESGKAAVLTILLGREGAAHPDVDRARLQLLRPLLLRGLPFAIIALLSLLSERADLFFLATIRGIEETGTYAGAERFLMLGNLFAFSFYGSALPIFSSLRGKAEHGPVVRKTLVAALALASIVAASLGIGAEWIIGATFRFDDSVLLLRVLAASLPGIVLNSILRIALFALDRERPVAMVFLVALALNTGLNFVLIPHFGALAAAWVAVGTEYFVTFWYARLYLSSRTSVRQGTPS
jgi:O-antigen/teichoic acid export membrane protein